MQRSMGLELTREGISEAAKITFVNVVLISAVCTIIDGVRRWFMVARPVHRIAEAADKVIKGDFSVRIQPIHSLDHMDGFNIIIDYFNRMTKELSGIETLRTDFISNVSHELKTPLAVMQNYGTMLQQPDLPEEKRMEYAKAVADASRRLANLISNALKFTEPGGKVSLVLKTDGASAVVQVTDTGCGQVAKQTANLRLTARNRRRS